MDVGRIDVDMDMDVDMDDLLNLDAGIETDMMRVELVAADADAVQTFHAILKKTTDFNLNELTILYPPSCTQDDACVKLTWGDAKGDAEGDAKGDAEGDEVVDCADPSTVDVLHLFTLIDDAARASPDTFLAALRVARDLARARSPHLRRLELQDESTMDCAPGQHLRMTWMDVFMGRETFYQRHLVGARPWLRMVERCLLRARAAVGRPVPSSDAAFEAWWERLVTELLTDVAWLAENGAAVRAAYDAAATATPQKTWGELLRALHAQHGDAFFVACEDALARQFGLRAVGIIGAYWRMLLDDLPTTPMSEMRVTHLSISDDADEVASVKERARRAHRAATDLFMFSHRYNHSRRAPSPPPSLPPPPPPPPLPAPPAPPASHTSDPASTILCA